MNDFLLYFELGYRHVLDIQAYDHILFLIVLVVSFSFKQWKNMLWLVSVFTIGHTFSLALSSYKIVYTNSDLVEFLIPLTILLTAVKNIFTGVKTNANSKGLLFLSFCFGWIHGLGFSNYFKMLISDLDSKFFELIEFSLGIELAQIIIVVVIVALYHLLTPIFKISKKDWILVISSIVIGIIIPMLMERYDPFIKYLF
ncbi:HupE/UreJ family protein [Flavicella sp.]|uniref:HupE/UreJ family protein n=1 Tax=Flavicella sp. TaxID=2957742 RepID=UPI00301688D0